MNTQIFYNTGSLIKHTLKRDKVRLGLWLLSLILFTVVVGFAYPVLYPDADELMIMAEGMKNPAMVAMFGPVFDVANYTIAVAMSNQMLVFSMLLAGVMSLFVVTKLTRADEEEGILEMIQSLPVGRLANSMAVIVIVTLMNVLLGGFIGFGLWMIPEASFDFVGSMAFGLSTMAAGILIAGITLVIVQLFENNRTVMGVSFLVVGVMYVVRGIGDISDNFLAWIVPFNWPLRAQVYLENNNWLSFLTIAMGLLLFGFGLYLNNRRDLEAGLFAQKPGRTEASRALKSPLGFTLRLLRPSLITWGVTVFILGVSYGSIFGDLDLFVQDNDLFEAMLPGGDYTLTVQFMTVIMVVLALVSAIGPIMFMNRLASEERKNHTEHIYARAVSRRRVFGNYMVISIVGLVVMLSASILGMYSGIFASMEEPIGFMLVVQSGFAYLPALLFMLSVSVLIVGLFPSYTYVIWLYFVFAFFAIYLGNVIGLPEVFGKLTPFGYSNRLPIESFKLLPAVSLVLLSFVVGGIGYVGYQKRDLMG